MLIIIIIIIIIIVIIILITTIIIIIIIIIKIIKSLQMKIQAKAQRIRRYVKRSKQFSQKQMFANDMKKFFRNLGKDQISVKKPPKITT